MPKLLLFLLCLMLLPVYAGHAESMDFHGKPPDLPTVVIGNAWYLFAHGEIDKGAPERFAQHLKQNDVPEKSLLFIDSPGGNLFAGMELGKIIRQYRLHLYIGKDGQGKDRYQTLPGVCYSACALAFLGGEYRFSNDKSEYGVHRFYSPSQNSNEATAQIVSAAVVQYIRDMGVDPQLFTFMSKAGPDDLIRIDPAQMLRLNIVNNGEKPTKWSIESLQGSLYLKGERETWHGMNKFILICLPRGQIGLLAIYDPEGREKEILSLLNAHSLLIDGERVPMMTEQRRKVELINGWINAQYLLSNDLLGRIGKAHTIGIAMQGSYEAGVFMGFDGMDFTEGQKKLSGFLNTCKGPYGSATGGR